MTDLTHNSLSPQGEHAPGPKPLSPAAQAVRRDIDQIWHELHRWCRMSILLTDVLPITLEASGVQLQAGINTLCAAAIRAVVLQCEYCDDYGTSFIDPKDLLAIADELEGKL